MFVSITDMMIQKVTWVVRSTIDYIHSSDDSSVISHTHDSIATLTCLLELGLGFCQCSLFLCQLSRGPVEPGTLWLHHPVNASIYLIETQTQCHTDEPGDPGIQGRIQFMEINIVQRTQSPGTEGGRTSMARTHMHRDLAASETLPMISGWKSGCVQYCPIFFSTRSEMLSLSKCTSCLIKLDSPVPHTHTYKNRHAKTHTLTDTQIHTYIKTEKQMHE